MAGSFRGMHAVLLAALVLTGCDNRFDRLESRGIDLGDRIALLDATPRDQMPTTGSARYDGVAAVDFEGAFGLTASKIRLDADFDDGTVSGRMSDWARDTGNALESRMGGSVSIVGGAIDGNSMIALATGRLTKHEAVEFPNGTFDPTRTEGRVVLAIDGTFLGTDAEAIGGGIAGGVRYEGGTEGGALGIFGAERR